MPKSPAKRPAASEANLAPTTLPASIVNAANTTVQIVKQLRFIEMAIPHLAKDLQEAEKKGTVALARAFVALHRLMEVRDDIMKPLDELYKTYKTERIPAAFEQAGVPNQSLDEGFRVGLSHKYYASIKSGGKDDPKLTQTLRDGAYKWLRANGLGDIISTTVNSQTLSAAGKELLEDKNIELPDEWFNKAMVPNTSVTKTK